MSVPNLNQSESIDCLIGVAGEQTSVDDGAKRCGCTGAGAVKPPFETLELIATIILSIPKKNITQSLLYI